MASTVVVVIVVKVIVVVNILREAETEKKPFHVLPSGQIESNLLYEG